MTIFKEDCVQQYTVFRKNGDDDIHITENPVTQV